MVAQVQEVVIKALELRGAALELGRCRDLECVLDGPAGTGKTVACLYKLHVLLTMYPGAKALVARATQTSLAGSAMATFREHILDPREGVRYYGGSRIRPAAFEYPNGSLLVMNGLDKPERIRSYEFDLAFVNEATEITEDAWELVRSRLRHGKLRYHQLLADVNPAEPTHWLNQRMYAGITTRLVSRHEDNPRYYDTRTQDWTPEGRAYIEGVLGGLTGVRRSRYLLGLWASAEGTVYEDSFDRTRNIIDRFQVPPTWSRYLSIDFGYTNPFVCQWWAQDDDGRLYLYRELYKTRTLVEDLAKEIKRLSRWGEKDGDPMPRAIVCDHDAEGRATLERHLSKYTTAAKKGVSDGIQAVAARLRPAGDGRPRLYFFRDALVSRDPELTHAKLPASTIEEVDSYVWDTRNGVKQGEVPLKTSDHGMDAMRYAVSHLDLRSNKVRYSDRIY